MSKLHDFNLALCEGIRANFARNCESRVLASRLEQLPAGMVAWLSYDEDEVCLLSQDELRALGTALIGLPLGENRSWSSSPSLRALATDCIVEIRDQLGPTQAERWSESSEDYYRSLTSDRPRLDDGLAESMEWLELSYAFLGAMRKTEFLPQPDGSFSTPTHPVSSESGTTSPVLEHPAIVPSPESGSAASSREVELPDVDLQLAVERMREAIAKMPGGQKTPADELVRQANINRRLGKLALRELQRRGEYQGFSRAPPGGYPSSGESRDPESKAN